MSLHNVILSLGSNLPSETGEESVGKAQEWLETISCSKLLTSGIYHTRPHSGVGSDYTNAVVLIQTIYGSGELEDMLKTYELKAGRTIAARAVGRVPIDIDIVKYDELIIRRRDWSRGFFRQGFRLMCCRMHSI